MLEAWSSTEGQIHGVPLMAVSHGIYYNSSLFKKMNLAIPDTWKKLPSLSETHKNKGMTSFQAVKDIAPYVSKNQKLLKYAGSLQLFIQGKSPMWFGGSCDFPFFEAQHPDFKWSVFAIPAPEGKENVESLKTPHKGSPGHLSLRSV